MKTGIAYALFTLKDGKLYSQYIQTGSDNPIGVWSEANESAEKIVKENGRAYVKSKLGLLSFRPGKHMATIPLFNHIGIRQADGTLRRRKDSVICEIEYQADVNYENECIERSMKLNKGKIIKRDCCLDHLPYDGFYYYNTNTNAKVQWIIAHRFKINRILSEDEIIRICKANGVEAQAVEGE